MFCPIKIYKLLFIYSCFTSRSASDQAASLLSTSSQLQLNMNSYVEVKAYGKNNYYSNVTIFDNHQYSIYVYNPTINTSKGSINTLNNR